MIRYDLLFRTKVLLRSVSLRVCNDYLYSEGVLPVRQAGMYGYKIRRRTL